MYRFHKCIQLIGCSVNCFGLKCLPKCMQCKFAFFVLIIVALKCVVIFGKIAFWIQPSWFFHWYLFFNKPHQKQSLRFQKIIIMEYSLGIQKENYISFQLSKSIAFRNNLNCFLLMAMKMEIKGFLLVPRFSKSLLR